MNVFVVIPCFNESEVLPKLFVELTSLEQKVKANNYNLNFVFIDDGSNDDTSKLIKEFLVGKKDSTLINFTGNFGHQNALTAGFKYLKDNVEVDYVFVIDADLQDPPELLIEFLKKVNDGYNIVNGVRAKRDTSFVKKFLYSYYYKFFSSITTRGAALNIGDFCLFDKTALHYICEYDDKIPYLRGIRNLIGLKRINYEYERPERSAGESKYSYISLVSLALSGIIGFSDKLFPKIIIWAIIAFLFSMILLFATGVVYFFNTFIFLFTTIFTILFFILSLFLFTVGLLGSYLYVIAVESKNRPNYLIKEIFHG